MRRSLLMLMLCMPLGTAAAADLPPPVTDDMFAPVDEAFAKIDPAMIESLKTDDALLTKILTYHVVPGRVAAADVIAALRAALG